MNDTRLCLVIDTLGNEEMIHFSLSFDEFDAFDLNRILGAGL